MTNAQKKKVDMIYKAICNDRDFADNSIEVKELDYCNDVMVMINSSSSWSRYFTFFVGPRGGAYTYVGNKHPQRKYFEAWNYWACESNV